MVAIDHSMWTKKELAAYCYLASDARELNEELILEFLNKNIPLDRYLAERAKWQKAQDNQKAAVAMAKNGALAFPEIRPLKASFDLAALKDTAIILTAGGDGERLKNSLIAAGCSSKQLENFTKATWPLDHKTTAASTLGYNLLLLRAISRALGKKLPVIVTLGPVGSVNARFIPQYLATYSAELDIITVCQEERLHLTACGQIVLSARPFLHAHTNPDETGGPFMALKRPHERDSLGLIHYLTALGYSNCLALQATTICQPLLWPSLAALLANYEVAAIGVKRATFPPSDPYGTIVAIKSGDVLHTRIVEAHNRAPEIYALHDEQNGYLPYNSGMYAFKTALLEKLALPDFICPPKQILPELAPAGKVGYAAIDLLTLSTNSAVLLADNTMFAAFKSLDDEDKLIDMATKMLSFLPHIY